MPTRFDMMKESGCIATMIATNRYSQPPDIHHLTAAGRRRGDDYTIALSPWHHRGVKPAHLTTQRCSGLYGPSFAHGRKEFARFFGSDDYLLKVQNLILEMYEQTPWFNYTPHREVFQAIRDL